MKKSHILSSIGWHFCARKKEFIHTLHVTVWETYRRNKQTALSRLNRAVHVARKSVIKWKECMKKIYETDTQYIVRSECNVPLFCYAHIHMPNVSLRRDTCIRHHLHTRLAINAFLIVQHVFDAAKCLDEVGTMFVAKFSGKKMEKESRRIEKNYAAIIWNTYRCNYCYVYN